MNALLDSLPIAAGLFLLSTVAILVAGIRLAGTADLLADRTGMGEALAGAIFVGGATSLPGLMTTTVSAWNGLPDLAVSNAIGGIAAQTLWLVFADFGLRGKNLEHSAASPENLLQAGILIALLALPLLAMNSPDFSLWAVHPASPALLLFWVFGMRMIRQSRQRPMWFPRHTSDTVEDEPDDASEQMSLRRLWWEFAGLTVVMGLAGYGLAKSAAALSALSPLSESVVGGVFTAMASSLPELVVAVAAVRRGALTLAISNVIGGNCLDTLFLFCADVAYREGSIYHAVALTQRFFMCLTIFMVGVLLMGLVRREREGFLKIGFESAVLLAAYLLGVTALSLFPPS